MTFESYSCKFFILRFFFFCSVNLVFPGKAARRYSCSNSANCCVAAFGVKFGPLNQPTKVRLSWPLGAGTWGVLSWIVCKPSFLEVQCTWKRLLVWHCLHQFSSYWGAQMNQKGQILHLKQWLKVSIFGTVVFSLGCCGCFLWSRSSL